MKRVAATQVAKSASNAARKAQFASSRVGAALLANNETKSKTKAAVVKKVATKKDTWNQKINRATDRAVLHVFRQAFLALDVVQTVHAHGSTASVTCTDSNNHANVFLALTTYTTPLEMNATLRQVVSFESSAHSPRVPSGEVTARAQLKFSAWKLVDKTTDGTALCVYQYAPDGAVAQSNGSCCPSLVAIVWRDGLQVHSLYAIHSIPLVTSTLLSRVATTLEDDIDPCFGLQGYTIAVSLRSFDQAVWDYEGYVVDFPSDLPPGATETCASLLVPQVRCPRFRSSW
ncbi:hypothetical protein, variant [Aphanomyces invadans]|uniref:Uncharacterized protein n=1 Tax=Aphanomyces invadans TaxID=157072 RepID=A0A024UKL0_9STRA|nr:hypothetical protein, variant [Aphanomyces invadans]ETW06956.1 hypothetical protein, variant [Aphanomyces invadans]|eukprot:XP_008865031.1 hypothetical protein, variant [Aphanomyces invadans]